MAGYIMSGNIHKLLLADSMCENPLNFNEEWHALEKEAEPLEEELENLRTVVWRGLKLTRAVEGAALDRVRVLRARLSAIDARQHEIVVTLNPKYAQWWFGNKHK